MQSLLYRMTLATDLDALAILLLLVIAFIIGVIVGLVVAKK